MDDQDFGRDGEASSSHPDIPDAPEFIASMETLALVGSVIPFATDSEKNDAAAENGLLSDIEAISRVSALGGLDAAIAKLSGAPETDPFADECLNDIAHVVAMMVEDVEACVDMATSPPEPATAQP
ncbi:MAG: hypothetical protein VCC99_07490, partial [Alphaproteobacteria bacterium]